MPQTESGAPQQHPARFDASWLALIAAALLLAYVASRVWQNDHPAKPGHAAEVMAWVEIAQATSVAKQTGKPILYDFSADWCQPCQMLKREVFENPVHAKAIAESVVPVKVIDRYQELGQNPPDIAELQQRFGVDGFPTLVVVDPASGRAVQTVGFMGAMETVAWAKQAANTVRLGVNPDGTPVR